MVPAEAELIREAARRVLNGETLVSIVGEWNDRGVTTTTGGPWRINALSSLLIQPRLAGGGPVPAILDAVTHQRLLALRHARRKEGPADLRREGHRRYLLTGFLRCWRCGARLGGTTRVTTTGSPCYRCPSRGAGGCSGVVIPTRVADAAAGEAVVGRADDPDFVESVKARTAHLAEQEQRMAALLMEALVGRPGGDGSDGLWTDGRQIDEEAWRRLRAQIENRARAAGCELTGQALLVRQRELCSSPGALHSAWPTMDLAERRSMIEAVVDHFVVLPARRPPGSVSQQRLKPVWRD